MMHLRYDGSYEGFLSLVYDVYHQKLPVSAISKDFGEKLIFEEMLLIETDYEKAQKVHQSLQKAFSKENLTTIFHVFMCDTKAFELHLLHFIQLGFKNSQYLENINIEAIFEIHALEKSYLRLVHKMYGFVRFEELEDKMLYAKVETKYNIVPLLGAHFLKRLGNIDFIIHDIKRSLAYVKQANHASMKEVSSFETPTLSSDEKHIKTLWKTFFNSIRIESRHNPKLQKSLVPLIYRTYMSEFD